MCVCVVGGCGRRHRFWFLKSFPPPIFFTSFSPSPHPFLLYFPRLKKFSFYFSSFYFFWRSFSCYLFITFFSASPPPFASSFFITTNRFYFSINFNFIWSHSSLLSDLLEVHLRIKNSSFGAFCRIEIDIHKAFVKFKRSYDILLLILNYRVVLSFDVRLRGVKFKPFVNFFLLSSELNVWKTFNTQNF